MASLENDARQFAFLGPVLICMGGWMSVFASVGTKLFWIPGPTTVEVSPCFEFLFRFLYMNFFVWT